MPDNEIVTWPDLFALVAAALETERLPTPTSLTLIPAQAPDDEPLVSLVLASAADAMHWLMCLTGRHGGIEVTRSMPGYAVVTRRVLWHGWRVQVYGQTPWREAVAAAILTPDAVMA